MATPDIERERLAHEWAVKAQESYHVALKACGNCEHYRSEAKECDIRRKARWTERCAQVHPLSVCGEWNRWNRYSCS